VRAAAAAATPKSRSNFKPKPKDPNAPKKPRTAYILFSMDFRRGRRACHACAAACLLPHTCLHQHGPARPPMSHSVDQPSAWQLSAVVLPCINCRTRHQPGSQGHPHEAWSQRAAVVQPLPAWPLWRGAPANPGSNPVVRAAGRRCRGTSRSMRAPRWQPRRSKQRARNSWRRTTPRPRRRRPRTPWSMRRTARRRRPPRPRRARWARRG